MKILNLQVENIKRIKAIDITPVGNTVIIAGRNGNGKSSTMDSIAYVLGGSKLIPDMPIRQGELKASIKIDLGEYIVTRHWTSPENSYLKLETPDGAKISNGQNVLNSIIGNLSFDPLEFSTLDPKKRLEILKGITGLDFSALDKEFKEKYEERRIIGKEGESLKALMADYQDIAEIKEPENITEIVAKRNEANNKNNEIRQAYNNILSLEKENERFDDEIKELEKRIDVLKHNMNGNKQKISELTALSGQKIIDISSFDQKIEEYHAYQATKTKVEQKTKLEAQLADKKIAWSSADKRLKEIEAEKQTQIKNANMPIEGLSFGDNEVFYNEIPFAQLSTSEQIRVSMAIAIAQNPKLKVIMINNGSLLDDDALSEVEEIAKENDFQVWIEKVSSKPDANCIFIEDGQVKESAKKELATVA